MELLIGIAVIWIAAAAVVTLGLARGAAADVPFRLDHDRLISR